MMYIDEFTLPETNSSHLKIISWKTTFLSCPAYFQGLCHFYGGVFDFFLNMPWSSKIEACDFKYEVACRAPWSFTDGALKPLSYGELGGKCFRCTIHVYLYAIVLVF